MDENNKIDMKIKISQLLEMSFIGTNGKPMTLSIAFLVICIGLGILKMCGVF